LALGLVASVGGLAVVAWLGFEAGFGRWMQLSPYNLTWNARFAVAHGSLTLWRQFPVFGTGLGSFRAAFPLVEGKALTVSSWSHAHNDFLELLTTGGVVAVALLAAALWVSLRRLVRLLMCRVQRSESRAAALAALGIVLSLAAHELVDFGLSLPANAFIVAVLLGAALGVPVPKGKEPRDEFLRARNGGHPRSE